MSDQLYQLHLRLDCGGEHYEPATLALPASLDAVLADTQHRIRLGGPKGSYAILPVGPRPALGYDLFYRHTDTDTERHYNRDWRDDASHPLPFTHDVASIQSEYNFLLRTGISQPHLIRITEATS